MRRSTLIVWSVIGLLAALAAAGNLASSTIGSPLTSWDATQSLYGAVAGTLAAVVLFGRRPTRWFWFLPVVVLSGVTALLTDAVLNAWLFVHQASFNTEGELVAVTGGPSATDILVLCIVAAVLYLVAATLYGFAGQAQGVKVGARTGLLVLLLLSVVPLANIVGVIGFLVTAIRRRPE